ncbi:MAG: hypothetical protein U0U66_05440 [Cytophagaceae bacterium]
MNKKIKYAINGAAIGAGAATLLNTIKQCQQMNQDPTKLFDWQELLTQAGKGALIGGGAGLGIGAIVDYQNSQETPINTDAFLYSIINNVSLNKSTNIEFSRLDSKANKVISIIKRNVGHLLAEEPTRLGSTEKGTALSNKFDIDIGLLFKPGSFSSTEKMYSYLLNLFERRIGKESIIDVRDQKKSIGVVFLLFNKEYKIDVVPNKQSFSDETAGYLFVNNGSNSTYTKTDFKALKSIRYSKTQKEIIVLLKHWKQKHDLPLSSHLLENLVKDAYVYNSIPKSFTKKVIMVMKHIRDNLDCITIRSIENTNNILTNISDSKKQDIISACNKAIKEYEYQPNSVVETFKVK